MIWLIPACEDLQRSDDEQYFRTSAARSYKIDLLVCMYRKFLWNNQSLLSLVNPVGWLSLNEPRPGHQSGHRRDPGKDKALSIALHFPSTLFLNHPGLNVPLCPIGSLPFHYILRELALNKHLPATCSFALAELPSSIWVNSKGLHYRVCSKRIGKAGPYWWCLHCFLLIEERSPLSN